MTSRPDQRLRDFRGGALCKRSFGRVLRCSLFGFTVSFLPLLTSLSLGFLHGTFVLMFGVIGTNSWGRVLVDYREKGSARDGTLRRLATQ